MYPTYETIKQLAETGEYRRIPVYRELYADRYTPVEVMRILRGASRHCYLLGKDIVKWWKQPDIISGKATFSR